MTRVHRWHVDEEEAQGMLRVLAGMIMREANVEAGRSGQPERRTSSYAFRQEVSEGVLPFI